VKGRVTSLLRPGVAVCTAGALLLRAAAVPVYADAAASAVQATAVPAAENVQTSFGGGVATITYDLIAFEGATTFDVTLEVSTNGGQTYDAQPRATSGDVGRSVPAGRGKRIVWEFAKDVESLQISQFRFRVVSRAEPQSGGVASTPQRAPEPLAGVQLPPATPTASVTARRQTGGNRLLWPGMAMFGGGGALAALAGAGPLRTRTDYPTYYELKPSKPAMYGGIGIGAAGLVMMLVGRSRASSAAIVVPTPGGIMLYRVTVF
jgi:hypothetical protein